MTSLAQVYADAWHRVTAWEQALESDPKRQVARSALQANRRAIETAMGDLDATSKAWIERNLPEAYARGARTIGNQFHWNTVHRGAIEVMAKGLYTDLLAATDTVSQTTRDLVRRIGRDATLREIVNSQTPAQASRYMRNLLSEHGVHAITYSNGARHGLDDYSRMAIRTTTATAYNTGTLNQAPEVDRWEVLDGAGCGWATHGSPELANGKIVSREEALSHPVSHPNCRRSFAPSITLTQPKAAKLTGETNLKVTGDERQALWEYAWDVPQFIRINRPLREGKKMPDDLTDTVRHLDRITKDGRLGDGTTYRAVNNYPGLLDQLKVGGTIEDRGFISTSLSREKAEEMLFGDPGAVMFRIKVRNGDRGFVYGDQLRGMDGVYEQHEVLLPRGTRFRITKITRGNPNEVELEILDDATPAGGKIRVASRRDPGRATAQRVSNRPSDPTPAPSTPKEALKQHTRLGVDDLPLAGRDQIPDWWKGDYQTWLQYVDCEQTRFAADDLMGFRHRGFAREALPLPGEADYTRAQKMMAWLADENTGRFQVDNSSTYRAGVWSGESRTRESLVQGGRVSEQIVKTESRALARRMDIPDADFDEFLGSLDGDVDLSLASFTAWTDKKAAKAGWGSRRGGKPVILRVIGNPRVIGGSGPDVAEELITGGRFRVVSHGQVGDHYEVVLEQIGVFDPADGKLIPTIRKAKP